MKAGVSITLELELLEKAKTKAEEANRSISNYVETALRKYLNGKDSKEMAEEILALYEEKDFPEINDIQKIIEGGVPG
jgi:metal-responsive CopG/Arc/MetJ family transcriptional regulator